MQTDNMSDNPITKEQIINFLNSNSALAKEILSAHVKENPSLKSFLMSDFIDEMKNHVTDIATGQIISEAYLGDDGRPYEGYTIRHIESDNEKSPFNKDKPLKNVGKARVLTDIGETLVKFFPELKEEVYVPNKAYTELMTELNRTNVTVDAIKKILDQNSKTILELDKTHIDSILAVVVINKRLDLLFFLESYFPKFKELFDSKKLMQWEPFSTAIHYAIWNGNLAGVTELFKTFGKDWNALLAKSGTFQINIGDDWHPNIINYEYQNALQLAFENGKFDVAKFLIANMSANLALKCLSTNITAGEKNIPNSLEYFLDRFHEVHEIVLHLLRKEKDLIEQLPEYCLQKLLPAMWLNAENFELLDRLRSSGKKTIIENTVMRKIYRERHYANMFALAIHKYETTKDKTYIDIFYKMKEFLGTKFEDFFLSDWSKEMSTKRFTNGIYFTIQNPSAYQQLKPILNELNAEKVANIFNDAIKLQLLSDVINKGSTEQFEIIIERFGVGLKKFIIDNSATLTHFPKAANLEQIIDRIIDLIGIEEFNKLTIFKDAPKNVLSFALQSGSIKIFKLIVNNLQDNLQVAIRTLVAKGENILKWCCEHNNAEFLATVISTFGAEKVKPSFQQMKEIQKLLTEKNNTAMKDIIDKHYNNSQWLFESLEDGLKNKSIKIADVIANYFELFEGLEIVAVEKLLKIANENRNIDFIIEVATCFEKFKKSCENSFNDSWGDFANVVQFINLGVDIKYRKELLDKLYEINKTLVCEQIMTPLIHEQITFLNLVQVIIKKTYEAYDLLSYLTDDQKRDVLNASFMDYNNYFDYIYDIKNNGDRNSFMALMVRILEKSPNFLNGLRPIDKNAIIQLIIMYTRNKKQVSMLPIDTVKSAIKQPVILFADKCENLLHGLIDTIKPEFFEEMFNVIYEILQDEIKSELEKDLRIRKGAGISLLWLMISSEKYFVYSPAISKIYTKEELIKLVSRVQSDGNFLLHKVILECPCEQIIAFLNLLDDDGTKLAAREMVNGYNAIHIAIKNSNDKKFNYLIKKLGETAKELCLAVTPEGNTVQLIRRYGNAKMLQILMAVIGKENLKSCYILSKADRLTNMNPKQSEMAKFVKDNALLEIEQNLIENSSSTLPDSAQQLISNIASSSLLFFPNNSNSNNMNTSSNQSSSRGSKHPLDNDDKSESANKRKDFGKK